MVEAGDQMCSVVVAFQVADPRLCLARSRLKSILHLLEVFSMCLLLESEEDGEQGYCELD